MESADTLIAIHKIEHAMITSIWIANFHSPPSSISFMVAKTLVFNPLKSVFDSLNVLSHTVESVFNAVKTIFDLYKSQFVTLISIC